MAEDFKAGKYTLLVDRYDRPDGTHYERGDELDLDAAEAKRLGSAGAVGVKDGFEARKARGEIQALHVDPNATPQDLQAMIESLTAQLDDAKRVRGEMDDPGPVRDRNFSVSDPNELVANSKQVTPHEENVAAQEKARTAAEKAAQKAAGEKGSQAQGSGPSSKK